jgi:hypothetical protein
VRKKGRRNWELGGSKDLDDRSGGCGEEGEKGWKNRIATRTRANIIIISCREIGIRKAKQFFCGGRSAPFEV